MKPDSIADDDPKLRPGSRGRLPAGPHCNLPRNAICPENYFLNYTILHRDKMSRQARFEEIEDDDDPPELELPDLESSSSALLSPNDLPQPSFGGMPQSADDSFKPHMVTQQDMEQFKRWSCIYPVYFDSSRTLQEGRRVPLHMAVRNPLAKDLADAAASMGIQSVLEVFPSLLYEC